MNEQPLDSTDTTSQHVTICIGRPIGVPNKSCKKCYGRGFIGRNIKTNQLVKCRCTK